MKHVLCVHLHQLPIDRLRRRQPALRHEPFVLVQTIGNRQIVAHVARDWKSEPGRVAPDRIAPDRIAPDRIAPDRIAPDRITPDRIAPDRADMARLSPQIVPGMSLAEAKGRHLNLLHFPIAPADDLRTLEAVGRWLMKFSPNVALAPPASIFLDATGIERLFGGIGNFRNRVAGAMKSLRFTAGVAVAPSPGAAWGLAAFGKDQTALANAIAQENLPTVLAPLPPEALRLEPEIIQSLASLGIRTIGELLRLDRKSLAVRFGASILLRIDQAMGTAPEPMVFLKHHTPIRANLEFEGAVESLEVIHLAVRQLVGQIAELLARRELGARELRIVFQCPYAPSVEKTIQLMRPSRNVPAIFNLLRCALENVPLDDGVIGIELLAPITQVLGDEQARLTGGEQEQNAAELEHLVDRLRARLDRSVHWAQLVESHIPERAFHCRDTAAKAVISPHHARIGEFRPLHLLPCPRLIKVIVTPSESLDGQPISFTDAGAVHRLQHVRGPERMTGEWWTGQHKTRDYFDVLDSTGNRYWLFRISETRRWYLHGSFE